MDQALALKELQDRKRHEELKKAQKEALTAVLSELESEAQSLYKQIETLRTQIAEIAPGDAQQASLEAMRRDFDASLTAIRREIASQPVPTLDLSPVLQAINSIPKVEMPEIPEEKQEWRFDVKRDQKGFIKEVIAT